MDDSHSAPVVSGLIAFGKHPAWNDHIEPVLGTTTTALDQRLVSGLYERGIQGNIPAWKRLQEEDVELLPFDHRFMLHTGEGLILGRMWASADGRGRREFPFILACHLQGKWGMSSVERVLAVLEEQGRACLAVKETTEVQDLVAAAAQELEGRTPSTEFGTAVRIALDEPMRSWFSHEHVCAENYAGLAASIQRLQAVAVKNEEQQANAGPKDVVRIPGSSTSDSLLPHALALAAAQVPTKACLLAFERVDSGWVDLLPVALSEGAACQGLRLPLQSLPFCPITDDSRAVAEEVARNVERIQVTGRFDTPLIPLPESSAPKAPRLDAVSSTVKGKTGEALDSFGEEIARLRDRLPVRTVLIAGGIALGLALLLLVVSILYSSASKKQQTEQVQEEIGDFDPKDWQELCGVYHDWFGSLEASLEESGDLSQLMLQDRQLAVALDAYRSALREGPINPREIARIKGGFERLQRTPPDSAKSPQARADTKRAVAVIRELSAGIVGRVDSLQEELNEVKARFAERGWQIDWPELAQFPQSAEVDLALITHLDVLMQQHAKCRQIEEEFVQVEAMQKIIAEPQLALLRGYPVWHANRLASVRGAEELLAAVRAAQQEGSLTVGLKEFASEKWELLDHAALSKSLQALTASEESYWRLLEQADGFVKLSQADDPRAALADTEKAFKQADLDIAELRKRQVPADSLVGNLQRLRKTFADLQAIPGIAGERDALALQSRQLQQSIRELEQDIAYVRVSAAGADGWCENLEAMPKWLSEPSLSDTWEVYREILVDRTSCEQLAAEPNRSLVQFQQMQSVREALKQLDGAVADFRRSESDLSIPRQLQAVLSARKAADLRAVLVDLDWRAQNVGAALNDRLQADAWAKRLQDSKRYLNEALHGARQIAQLRAGVENGHRPDEKLPEGGSLQALVAALEGMADAELRGVVLPLVQNETTQVQEARKLRETEASDLVTLLAAEQKAPTAARAAWKQVFDARDALGSGTGETLAEAYENVAASLASLPGDRRRALEGGLLREHELCQNRFRLVEVRELNEALQGDVAQFRKQYATKAGLAADFETEEAELISRVKNLGEQLDDGATAAALAAALTSAQALRDRIRSASDPNAWLRDVAVALSQGLQPDDEVAAGRTMAEMIKQWDEERKEEPPEDLKLVRTCYAQLLHLQRAPKATILSELGADTSGACDYPAHLIAAWERLQQDQTWPESVQDLAVELNLREQLEKSELSPPVRARLEQQMRETGLQRWRAARKAGMPIPALAKDALEAFRMTMADLSPREQLACLVADALALSNAGSSEAQILQFRDELVARLQKQLGAQNGNELVTKLLAQLAALDEEPEIAVSPESVGPISAGIGARPGPTVEGELVYLWQNHELRFVLVVPPRGAPCYVSAHECSLGLFKDAVAQLGVAARHQVLQRLSERTELCGWEASASEVKLASKWHVRQEHVLPEGTGVGSPDWNLPVQGIDTATARVVAGLLGCRLPSESEWLAALAMGSSGQNLPDPSLQAIRPLIEEITDLLSVELEARKVSLQDDGYPLFAPVRCTPAKGFCYLQGNVAELVTQDSLPVLLPGAVVDLPEVDSLVAMGGSALSAPIPTNRHPLEYPTASDVGFRLAFSAGKPSLAMRYQTTLKEFVEE